MKTIVDALKELHTALGGGNSDAETTVEAIEDITKVVDNLVLKVKVAPITDDSDLFGKTADELQSNIKVSNNSIIGKLNYVSDYTGFSSNPEQQSGNYLALKATANSGAVITGELIGGTSGAVTLDSDGMIVFRVANNQQSVKFVATLGGKTASVEFALTDLDLESAEESSCEVTFAVMNEDFDTQFMVDVQPEDKIVGGMGGETYSIMSVLKGDFTYTAGADGYISQSGTFSITDEDLGTAKRFEITLEKVA